MELWTAYEGVTIDGAFPLKKLVAPEGRSAFFSTANRKGESVLIRLIECHFDEEEILARWRGVEALGHPNFLKLDHFGQLEIDSTTVVYAVFERADNDLAQVLQRGRLSFDDTVELGLSLASALETLHSHGFVHEHLEPRNIFAVGEVVKLRGDCIRETPEGEAGNEARRRDIRDLGMVLLQALTQKRTPDVVAVSALPAPFDEVVRQAATGAWGFAEISTALEKTRRQQVRPAAGPAAPRKPSPPEQKASPTPVTAAPPRPESAQPKPAAPVQPAIAPRSALREGVSDIPLRTRWIGAAILVALVMLIGWLSLRSSARKAASTAAIATTAKAEPVPHPAHSGAPTAASAKANAGAARGAWRVIAYTYNRRDQARKKASSLAQRHPDLRPEVFTPSGGAPFLVSVGGNMNKDAAYALARRANALGLPRDTYAQNYSGR